ncbi:MAG: glycosyltransferase, partial [Solirubrobacteraceae bacterium]
ECLEQVALYFKMQHLRGGYGRPKVVPGGYVGSSASLYQHYCRLRSLRRGGGKVDVYGRFGTKFAADMRRQAVELLRGQSRFSFTGGTSLVLFSQSLREAAQARVCVDLPGNGPFCHRLVDYLAIGACVVGPRHATNLHTDLVDRENIVYCREDFADLVDLCAQYVEDDEAREEVGANAARFFDEQLHPRQLAAYYLRTIDARLGAADGDAPRA